MPRVSSEEVKQLIDTNRDTCDPFIEVAHAIVNEHVTAINDTTILTHIELYLAAHFTAITEERGSLIRSGLGESAETYQDLYKGGFASTRFGQQAITMDYSGALKQMSVLTLKAVFRTL